MNIRAMAGDQKWFVRRSGKGNLTGVLGNEVGSIFNILLFCFVFDTFQVTLEGIIYVRKIACALGRVIATEDILLPNSCRLSPLSTMTRRSGR